MSKSSINSTLPDTEASVQYKNDPEVVTGKDHEIKIVGQTWSVQYSNSISELGKCDHSHLKIIINDSYNSQVIKNVYLHEALHAISGVGDLDLSERQVDVLATLLISFFQDNPQLVNYFFRKQEQQ